MKVYIVGVSYQDYVNWMPNAQLVEDITEADVVLFTGGEDVSPSLYGKNFHPTTSSNIRRDWYEVKFFKQAKRLRLPMLGICRGAQFLCVMNGGTLIQHQEEQPFIHRITIEDDKTLFISSTHHQAQYPFDLPKKEFKVIGWTQNLSSYHHGESWEDILNPPKECEIVYYPKTRALGIQGHPEMIYGEKFFTPTITYCRELLNKLIKNDL